MCDYSLEHVESRPAKVGDQLVSTVFSNSITRGFAEEGNPQVAVCLLRARSSYSSATSNAITPLVFSRPRKWEKTPPGSGASTRTVLTNTMMRWSFHRAASFS